MATGEQSRVKINHRVLIALDVLAPPEKERVEHAIQALATFPEVDPSAGEIRKLGQEGSLYVIRVSPETRLFFEVTDQGIEALDVVLRKTLEMFKRKFSELKEWSEESNAARKPDVG